MLATYMMTTPCDRNVDPRVNVTGHRHDAVMAITPVDLDEVIAGFDHVLELLDDVRRTPPGVPSALARLDACQRRASVLLGTVLEALVSDVRRTPGA